MRLEETVEVINRVRKPKFTSANFVTVVGGAGILAVWINVTMAMSDMIPVAILIIFATMLLLVPAVLTVRFNQKGTAVNAYIDRLKANMPSDKGVVHFEKLEYGRMEVWNMSFMGHRTGLTQRTAVAIELWLMDRNAPTGIALEKKVNGEKWLKSINFRMPEEGSNLEQLRRVKRVIGWPVTVNYLVTRSLYQDFFSLVITKPYIGPFWSRYRKFLMHNGSIFHSTGHPSA